MRNRLIVTLMASALSISGCMNDYVIPDTISQRIDRTVRYTDLKRDPEAHKGRTVALGGLVLRARNLKDGTEIEVLQLPLSRQDQPDAPLEASQGRFMVLDSEHPDPAVLKDRRITIVGEVIGKKIATIDEYEYPYPYLSARFIYIWPQRGGYAYAPTYYYPPYYYYPGLYPYWYPPYGYYGPPVWRIPKDPPPHRRFEDKKH